MILNNVVGSQIDSLYVLGAGKYGVHLNGGIINQINRLTASINLSDHEPSGSTVAAPTDAWLFIDQTVWGGEGGNNTQTILEPRIEGDHATASGFRGAERALPFAVGR